VAAIWTVAGLVAAMWAVDERWWQGPLVIAFALIVVLAGVRHCSRRFGGISGDVLGATVETTTMIVAVGFLLGP